MLVPMLTVPTPVALLARATTPTVVRILWGVMSVGKRAWVWRMRTLISLRWK
ncbi:hypothetical protein [Sphingomonas elodea]|uniref:hypothetical protein n=1 Tax=Sphingomonas elodea TaxID=179878 RepID=UPI001300C726|nr:hypothetical protein [Sphingomonas elodea]